MVSISVVAQRKYPFSGRASTGFITNHTDLSSNDYPGEKPNLFVSGGLSYYLEIMDAWLCGDVMYGNVDGNNDTVFFTNSFYSGSLTLKFDILKWFADTRLQLNPKLGLGVMLYHARLYNTQSRNVIQESPPYQDKALSPNPNVEFGVELAYPLNETVSIEVGYTRKVMFGNDYFDAFLRDSPFEKVDLFSAGLSFRFGKGSSAVRANSKKVRNTDEVVEMTNEEYSSMVYRIDSLENKLARGNPKGEEKYIAENERLQEEIRGLNRTIDSLEADVFDFDFTGVNDTALFDLNEGAFSEAKYHLVLCNVKSQGEAQAYINRSELDQSKMHIIFVPIEKRYSVLYKSFDNFLLARKERGIVKHVEPRVWIARF